MPKKTFKLDEQTVVLPRGTKVVLRTDVGGADGYLHKEASLAVVRDVSHHTYFLETPSGRQLTAQRDQITVQREDLLADLGRRQWEYRKLQDEVIYASVVGSQAWGLADDSSDEDVRGCFVAPFEEASGLWDMPDDLVDPSTDASYWEVDKFVEQALRGDANTLETLWSPLHVRVEPLGRTLLEQRRMFVSMNVLGSFGRYAQSQFKKIERSLKRDEAVRSFIDGADRGGVQDVSAAAAGLRSYGIAKTDAEAKKEVQAVCRSLFDRGLIGGADFDSLLEAVAEGRRAELVPTVYRPKNAYNLLRLLHSCVSWLRTAEPLIRVEGPLRDRLLAIKAQRIPIEDVVAEAKAVADTLDDEASRSALPERPDYDAADRYLKLCRREAARRAFGIESGQSGGVGRGTRGPGLDASDGVDDWTPELFAEALPPDVDIPALRRFLMKYLEVDSELRLAIVWIALTGSHAYGFPSPDSDLDLKGVFVASADRMLGLKEPKTSVDYLDVWEGRELDLTLNELGKCAALLLQGNGNLVERFLGPFRVVTTPLGHRLAELARGALSKRVARHYQGFFKGMRRESDLEARAGGRRAKTLLYAYRVALTGAHLLRTGELVTDVRVLAEMMRLPAVHELVERKKQAEKQTLGEHEVSGHLAEMERLETKLADALEGSVLPDEPRNEAQMERFVVDKRLDLMALTQGERSVRRRL